MRAVVLPVILCAFAVLSRADTCELTLTIVPEEVTLKRGEQLKVEATITNSGSSPVSLVLPGDGSQVGWRTPVIAWSLVPEKAALPYPQAQLDSKPICGNINAFKRSEIFTLPRSAKRILNEWINPVVDLPPGRYHATMQYSNEPGRKVGGIPLEPHEPGAEDLIRSSTPCRVISNEVRVTILE